MLAEADANAEAVARRALDVVAAAELAEAVALAQAALKQLPEYALAASPLALLDAHGSLRLVTDAVHEDDALCLALACRAMRDALGVRFPACPRAGGRAVARLAARVTAAGVLDLSLRDPDASDDYGSDDSGSDDDGLRVLPEGFGRLAYLPGRGLRALDLSHNAELTALPEGLCSLAGLEELNLVGCDLAVLPEGIGRLAVLRKLNLNGNYGLTALPVGLWTLVGLEELNLSRCGLRALPEGVGGALAGLRKLHLRFNTGLTALPEWLCTLAGLEELDLGGCELRALPEGIGGLTGLRKLDLFYNVELTALPAGLGRLRNLEELDLSHCPGLGALHNLQQREGLPALLAHLDKA
jgi:Leucine-rich repeat (LRR) protein